MNLLMGMTQCSTQADMEHTSNNKHIRPVGGAIYQPRLHAQYDSLVNNMSEQQVYQHVVVQHVVVQHQA